MVETADILVIGAGIAGASAAYFLADGARVTVLEQEAQPGYHTTGRSAAMFIESYGNAVIRRLTTGGRAFFETPPDGFGEHPILSPRGTLFLARPDQLASVEALLAEAAETAVIERLTPAEAVRLNPALREDYLAAGLYEAAAEDIDVAALHGGFLRGIRARGGQVVTGAEVTRLAREGGVWRAETRAGSFAAPVVVNAPGAWCDAVAVLAGVAPVGLVPKRRTAFTFDPPAGMDPARWPATIDVDEQFYFKNEGGRIMGSPADETPSPPCDAQAEELDVAIGIDRIETATHLTVRRLASKRAGLRSFVADKTPVVGFEPGTDGFFWLAGQGGYGIQTSPSLGRATAALIATGDLPRDLKARGLTRAMLGVERLRAAG